MRACGRVGICRHGCRCEAPLPGDVPELAKGFHGCDTVLYRPSSVKSPGWELLWRRVRLCILYWRAYGCELRLPTSLPTLTASHSTAQRGPGCTRVALRPVCAAGDLGAGPGRRVWECGLLLAAYLVAHAGPSSLAGGLVGRHPGP